MTEDGNSQCSQRANPCQHSPSHKLSTTESWHAPNGQVRNQIGVILTSQRFKSSINKANTRSFPDADIGSDHDLLITTIKMNLKTKRFTKSPRIRFDLEELKHPKIAEVLQAKVDGQFAAVCLLDSNVDTLANSLKKVLLSAAT